MDSVDIIIPVYNDEKSILDAVVSALGQRGVLPHVVVVNDGSTDNIESVLRSSSVWGLFEYIRKENGGVSSARNVGLSRRHSDYCCFLDSDDMLEPQFAMTLISLLRANNKTIAYSNYSFVDENDTNRILDIKHGRVINEPGFSDILASNIFLTPTVLFKSQIVDGMRFDENLKYHEDWLFWLELLSRENSVCFCNSFLVKIRTRTNGLTSRMDLRAENYLRILSRIEKSYRYKYPTDYHNACMTYADNLRAFRLWKESCRYYFRGFPGKLFFRDSPKYWAKFMLSFFHCDRIIIKYLHISKDRYSLV